MFKEPIEVCVQRVMARHDHPTLAAGDRENAIVVRRMAQDFCFPSQTEGIDICRIVDERNAIEKVAYELRLYS